MKKIKTIVVMLLAVIMTMSVTVFASNNKGDLTVRVNRNNTLENQTIKLYKLFDLTTNGTSDAYTVKVNGEPVQSELKDGYNALSKMEENSDEIQNFADQFAK